MSTTVWSLLATCVVAWVIHRAPVMSQCTSKHCHDGDRDVGALAALVDRLQDTVERQQDSLKQQEQQNHEHHTLQATLTEQQQKEMTTLKETVEQQQQQNQQQHRQQATLTEQQQKEVTTLEQTVEQQQKQLMRFEDIVEKQQQSAYCLATPGPISVTLLRVLIPQFAV